MEKKGKPTISYCNPQLPHGITQTYEMVRYNRRRACKRPTLGVQNFAQHLVGMLAASQRLPRSQDVGSLRQILHLRLKLFSLLL